LHALAADYMQTIRFIRKEDQASGFSFLPQLHLMLKTSPAKQEVFSIGIYPQMVGLSSK
jgi:hypothetical protein